MKKRIGAAIAALLLLGCAANRPGPSETVSRYISDSLGGNYDNAYAALASADRKYISRASYGEKAGEWNPFREAFNKTTSFRVTGSTEQSGRSEVAVEFDTPNVEEYLPGILFGLLVEMSTASESIDVMDRIRSSILDGTIPRKSYSRVYDLVLEEEAWRVFLNLRGADEAARYKALGDDLLEEGDTVGAVRAYREAERANPRGPKVEQFIENAKRKNDKDT